MICVSSYQHIAHAGSCRINNWPFCCEMRSRLPISYTIVMVIFVVFFVSINPVCIVCLRLRLRIECYCKVSYRYRVYQILIVVSTSPCNLDWLGIGKNMRESLVRLDWSAHHMLADRESNTCFSLKRRGVDFF